VVRQFAITRLIGGYAFSSRKSGNADGSKENEDEGEWNIIIQKKRSIGQRLKSKGKIAANDKIVLMLEEIFCAEPTIRDVQRVE
jgi:hypothetical protein